MHSRAGGAPLTVSISSFPPNGPNQALIDPVLQLWDPPLSFHSSHSSLLLSSTCLSCVSARCIFSWWPLILLTDPIATVCSFSSSFIHPGEDFLLLSVHTLAHTSEMSCFAFFCYSEARSFLRAAQCDHTLLNLATGNCPGPEAPVCHCLQTSLSHWAHWLQLGQVPCSRALLLLVVVKLEQSVSHISHYSF